MSVVELERVTKSFGSITAVDNVSFNVKKGTLFGLLGPNGSGKTTMIKLLTGQVEPSSGSINVLGVNVLRYPIKVRELVGIIPEQETPPSFLTAEEYLEFVGSIRGLENIEQELDWWFDFFEFDNQRHILCKDLSRGTRQKLMIAQAFLHRPKLAFIDEPLINLDPVAQRIFKDFLLEYVGKGNTVFFSTHVLEIAEEICSEIGILDKGRLLHHGELKDLKEKQQHLEDFFLKLVRVE